MKRLCLMFVAAITALTVISCSTLPKESSPAVPAAAVEKAPLSKSFTVDQTYGSHMVLQRDVPIRLRGTCEPEKAVKVFIGPEKDENGTAYSMIATANKKGIWKAEFPALPASGPYTVIIGGSESPAVIFTDVMIGEVWLCSGQSNMAMPIDSGNFWWQDQDYKNIFAEAKDYPQIRIFNATLHHFVSPQTLQSQPKGTWTIADADQLKAFSATGYQFGKQLAKDLEGVAIGLISASWSGTKIEPWISRKSYTKANYRNSLTQFQFLDMSQEEIKAYFEQEKIKLKDMKKSWMEKFEELAPAGTAEKTANWAKSDFDDSTWNVLVNPNDSFPSGKDGVAWYRKTVQIPEEWIGKDLTLFLGMIDDCDWTFVNGQEVGRTLIDTAEYWKAIRNYTIPASLVSSDTLCIAVRVADLYADGGFHNQETPMYVTLKDNDKTQVSLNKSWHFNVEFTADVAKLGAQPNTTDSIVPDFNSPQFPSTLYNSMIHPWIHYPIRGVIWYQGCSNAGAAGDYYFLQQLLVKDWRQAWKNPNMPFIVTQLASYDRHSPYNRGAEDAWKQKAPGASNFGSLRESQWYAALKMHNVGMAVTLDIGDQYDIHPHNKKDVGYRLAKEAERILFSGSALSRGPVLKQVKFNGHIVELTFGNCPGGLLVKGEPKDVAKSFIIADQAGNFFHANTVVNGNKIIVWSPEVDKPSAVRYGWVSFTPEANLYNQAGFPASPFRTDLPEYIETPTFKIIPEK